MYLTEYFRLMCFTGSFCFLRFISKPVFQRFFFRKVVSGGFGDASVIIFIFSAFDSSSLDRS